MERKLIDFLNSLSLDEIRDFYRLLRTNKLNKWTSKLLTGEKIK